MEKKCRKYNCCAGRQSNIKMNPAKSAKENKNIVRRYYEEVINTGNIAAMEELVSEEYTEVYDGKKYFIGIEGAKVHIADVRETYPDLHISIERQIAENEWVATCVTVKGTQRKPWMGIKPTGKTVSFTGINVDRVVYGRIVEHIEAINMLKPLMETGAIKAAGAAE